MTADVFKTVLGAALQGEPVRALFITPNAPAREDQLLRMHNDALVAGLETVYRKADRTLQMGDAVVYLRIAHPYLDRELKGLMWNAIDGLEYLSAVDKTGVVADMLASRVRL